MVTLPEKTMVEYWVKKIPDDIKFISDEIFLTKGIEKELNKFSYDSPKPYGPKKLLTRGQERELFLKFNYAKYRATGIINHRSVKRWLTKASYYKDVIAYHNLNLVYKLVTKLCSYGNPEELEGAALFGLTRAIDGFDVGRGYKFSTYATWAIRTHVWRHKQKAAKHVHEDLVYSDDSPRYADPNAGVDIVRAVAKIDTRDIIFKDVLLNAKEHYVLVRRFGLDSKPSGTLKKISLELGITSECVRQTQNRALSKLRRQHEQNIQATVSA